MSARATMEPMARRTTGARPPQRGASTGSRGPSLGAHWRADGTPKTAYRSERDAWSVADEQRRQTGVELAVYRCDFCSAWHMGNSARPARVSGDGTPRLTTGGGGRVGAPNAISTGPSPATRRWSVSVCTRWPSSARFCHASNPPRRWSQDSGRPAATCGTRSTCCASVPNASGRSAPTRRSGCRVGRERCRRGSFLRRALPGGWPIALLAAAGDWREAAMEAPHDVTTGHPEAGQIGAFDIVQRNAHEVCHHLWDVQRGLPSTASRSTPTAT